VTEPRRFCTRRGDTGFALLAVMWAVTLLIVLAMVLSESVQLEVRTAIYRKEAARAHAIACGGVEAAILEIAYPRANDRERASLCPWQRGQREAQVSFGGGKAELQIASESGKLDLNAATREQLTRLFEARGGAALGAPIGRRDPPLAQPPFPGRCGGRGAR